MKKITAAVFALLLVAASLNAQYIQTKKDDKGWRLTANNKDIEIKGMVWAYTPLGETHSYNLWDKNEDFIMRMIDTDMTLLKKMGVNTIRCFSTIPPEWVEYIYTKYGIYTMINDLLGRYGTNVNGKWHAVTDYSDKYTRETLVEQARATARTYKGVKGVLMYMFGNESNYGLVWSGSNIENLPAGEQDGVKAGYLYSLLEEAMAACKEIDPMRPVGIVNGDTQYLEVIKALCPSLDILGVNAYRGYKFFDSFYENIAEVLDKPVVFTEAGADAYNAVLQQEDQHSQAVYLQSQWHEMYQQAYGKGKTGNVLGGYVFEWIDEWWKHYQNKELDIHNTVGTWSNAGYELDYKNGINNMNEEWFGIIAQSKMTDNGIHKRIPRSAYYLMADIWKLPLYKSSTEEVETLFASLDPALYLSRGAGQTISERIREQSMAKIDYVDINVQGFTPLDHASISDKIDDGKSFTEALNPEYRAEASIGVSLEPFENFSANVVMKYWTASPYTKLEEEWDSYKDTAFDVYSASFNYTAPLFDINGYYHVGHTSFEITGDIFSISKEAFDIIGYDTYGSDAPIALEFVGKDTLQGLQIIGGPEVYGSAKPQIMANYYRTFAPSGAGKPSFEFGAVYAEELGASEGATVNPYNSYGSGRKASLYGRMNLFPWLNVVLGVLHSGSEKVGADYTSASGETKQITWADTLGAHLELGTEMFQHTYIYAVGIYRGLVAETVGQQIRGGFYTADSGSGNRVEMRAGADFIYGPFTFKPVFRARVPIESPANRSLTASYPSPFIVYANRQAFEIEAVLTYDPEGATWFHDWNIDDIEGAPFAAALTALYTIYAGETDCMAFKMADGSWASFTAGLPEQHNLWAAGPKIIASPLTDLKIIGAFQIGHQGSTGEDTRIVDYWSAQLDARYRKFMMQSEVSVNDWGPQDWWRTFNITFPLQWKVDLSYGFTMPSFLESTNRLGVKWQGRTFDDNSDDPYSAVSGSFSGKTYSELTVYVNIRI